MTAADPGLFGPAARTGFARRSPAPRFLPAVDPRYRDDAPECPVCGCVRARDCRQACG